MTNVVGVSCFFHDSACCLIQDGVLIAAAEEERFSRQKHDSSLPIRAFEYCLEQGRIDVSQVDCLAYYEEPLLKFARQLWMLSRARDQRVEIADVDPDRVTAGFRDMLGYEGKTMCFPHHLSHAASSYYFSGMPEAAILTVDGVGEWATTTYGRGAGADISIFEEVHFPDSIGLLYSTLTSYLGFSVNDGEYKVMGLAPYGQPRYRNEVGRLIHTGPRGQFALDLRYFDFTASGQMFTQELVDLFGREPRPKESAIEQFHMDVARSLQDALQDLLIEKLDFLHREAPTPHLCLAGGVALNCVANRWIVRNSKFNNVFVNPAPHDAGGALGAAALAHEAITGGSGVGRLRHAYLGPAYHSDDVGALLSAIPVRVIDRRGDEDALLDDCVKRLAAGEVLGWFQREMEFGPRALGGRSILADPRHEGMRDRINALVKKREAFRPFAPSVLETRTADHFDIGHPSPFMLETCQVTSALDLPAITHVDGSARVHTVSEDVAPRFARLLAAFERHTGCPILLNTSFNVRDEPIVRTPADALVCFCHARLDALVLEDFIIERASDDDGWFNLCDTLATALQKEQNRISDRFYTFF